ncbi:ATP-grasp protein [Nitrospira sp. KM1]|uniref:carboxylate--amine ligase n=1 Tax=Nitrospira sp. KM1 TaxID=1936990 RepID=UPI0013A73914|nr:ATP-grasp domain-containing protein [Nitrospira sp. KM1]BCA54101.1 ATP-grasp protein [Nitrospira sp. KM1]
MMRVLITDGNERSSLAVTRALGAEGINVVVGAETDRSLAGSSRYCNKRFRYPSAYTEPKGFIDALIAGIRQEHVDFIIPISDMAMQLIADRRDEFPEKATRPMPDQATYETVSDKFRLSKMAGELGVPIPDTVFVENGRLPTSCSSAGMFPLIVKPAKSRTKVDGNWVATNVHRVSNREDLERLFGEVRYLSQNSLIQRIIEGEGQGIFALFDRGAPLALFAHRRIREKPPAGGVSVLRESIKLPKEMADYAVRLLTQVAWHGVAMVEFKIERSTGIPYLMEINGRFWGSLQLAIDAGMNFPALLMKLASGKRFETDLSKYRIGTKSRWLLGDLDHLLARIRKSDRDLNLPSDYPSRWACVKEFCRLFDKNTFYEVERWSDRGPGYFEWAHYLSTLMRGSV